MSEYGDDGDVSGDLEVGGTLYTPIDSLTLADTIDTDASTGNIFTVTLTGSNLVTLANPTNLEDGAAYSWIIKQDGDGGSDLFFGDDFMFKNGFPPAMISASFGINILEGISDGTSVYLLSNTALTSSAGADPRKMPRTVQNNSTLSYWYDANDTDYISKDGSNLVATWADKSGNNHDATQSTAGKKPTWTTNTIGGLPAIVFDGTADMLTMAVGDQVPLESDSLSIFIVAKTDDGSGDAHIFGIGSASPTYILSYGHGVAIDEGLPLVKSINNSSGVIVKGASSVADDDPFVLRGIVRDADSSLFINGVVAGTDTSNDPNPYTSYTGATIGASDGTRGGTGTDFFEGAVGEILCFTGAPLSDEEIRSVEKYLVDKWSLEDHYRS